MLSVRDILCLGAVFCILEKEAHLRDPYITAQDGDQRATELPRVRYREFINSESIDILSVEVNINQLLVSSHEAKCSAQER